ncbi:MAG: hypothetical protein KAR00_03465 [Candidatus Pacebacteria bacterium]|nr:hypothetical protein [Candidatus Paceibacterota bacterium]
MNAKKILLPVSLLALVGIIGLTSASSAIAYQGDYTQKGPNCTAERHEAMEMAFENNDYNVWRDLMEGRGRVSHVITEENFAQFAEAHKLAEQGKYTEADAIRQELGLRTSNGKKVGAGFGQGVRNGQTTK